MEGRLRITKDLIPQMDSRYSPRQTRGFTLIEVATSLIILGVLAAMLVPLATTLLDSQRAGTAETDLTKIYTAIVGDPAHNTYGYLGDVGAFPASLMDLVQQPAGNPPGWNGPYLSDARIDTAVIYDAFGGPVEYFQTNPAVFPAAATDQLALISRGPDRSSSNGAANPNVAANFTGVAPSAGTYASTTGNGDNVVYPHFTDNQQLVNYQSLGKLNINISNYDDAASTVMPACANYYNVVVASVPRKANEAYVNYNSGGASFDLLQGLYLVQVFVSGAATPAWQEQIAINPNTLTSRNITLSGVNSSLSATVTLNVNNTTGANLEIYQGATDKGAAATGGTTAFTVNACSRILVRNSSNFVVDSFIQPYTTGTTRRYNAAATCTMTFANQTYNTVAIYDDGVLLGSVGKRGNKRAKSFTVRAGDVFTFKDQGNNAITTSNLGAAYTIVCPPALTGQF
jgi:prepilin-type N-terminal cleavage/methylation domain-containing protein